MTSPDTFAFASFARSFAWTGRHVPEMKRNIAPKKFQNEFPLQNEQTNSAEYKHMGHN